jgi:hypothetical protein
MLDLLRATSLLYGDCTQEPNSSDIYISTGKVTAEQMIAITAKATELQAAYDAKAYARSRATAYPSIADQLDTIYHQGLDAWKATILAVKEEFPK